MFNLVFISAELFQFDNIKSYDVATKTVTIVNTFGLGKDIAKIQLNTPIHNKVPIGYNQVAEFQVNSLKDYTSAFGKMEFYDVGNLNNEIIRTFDYKYKTTELYDVEDYKQVCKLEEGTKNNTQICLNEVVGKHQEEREIWLPLEKADFTNGEIITIGIFTDVKPYDKVEWVLNAWGERLDMWADWTASLDIGLTNYYSLDESGTTGLVINNASSGASGNGYLNASGSWQTGKLGNSLYFNGLRINVTNSSMAWTSTNSTWAFWIKTNDTDYSDYKVIFADVNPPSGYNWQIDVSVGAIRLRQWQSDGGDVTSISSTAKIVDNNWHYVVITRSQDTQNYTLYIDNKLNITGQSTLVSGSIAGLPKLIGAHSNFNSNYKSYLDEIGVWNRTLSTAEISLLWNGGVGLPFHYTSPIPYPQVTLTSPTDYYNSTASLVTFNVTATDEQKIQNVTLYIDGIVNQTDTSNVNGTYSFPLYIAEGYHNWSILAYNNNSYANQSDTRYFWVDTIYPTITIAYPTNTTYSEGLVTIDSTTYWFNWTAVDANRDKCWWSNNSGVTNYTITCNANSTFAAPFEQNTFIAWVNDTFGHLTSSSITSTREYFIFENNRTVNSSEAYETTNENAEIFLTSNASLTNVYVNYNGTIIPATQSGNIWSATKMLYPLNIGNNTINWTATYSGINYTTNYSFQQVNKINISICGGTYTVPYLNISFKDEGNDSVIKAKVPSSTFIYSLGNGTISKTYIYSTATEDYNHTFCFSPPNRTVNVDLDFQYSGGSYPQRIYSSGLIPYTNATTNKTLYLLGSSAGIYVTFQVVDGSETPIQNVYVNASREIAGITNVVGEGLTGSDGGITFWLNPDFQHTVKFSKTGYDDYTYIGFPTQSIYTVQMSGGAATTIDYTRGVTISITPNYFTLVNGTTYNFSAITASNYWTITNWGFNLKNSTGFYYYNTSSVANGGLLQQNINTFDNDTFIMELYYKINGTYTNYTYTWTIENSLGDDWSIKTFGKDLKTYLGSGMFGLTNFGLSLILFFIIIIGTGIISYKFGFVSPAAIVAVIFGIVFLLDIGLGLMDTLNPIGAISHTPTIFVGLILVIFVIREVISQQ